METAHPKWDKIWTEKREKNFDTGCVLPALLKMINDGDIPKGRALVPGVYMDIEMYMYIEVYVYIEMYMYIEMHMSIEMYMYIEMYMSIEM
jgi:hypothetical protein